MTHGPAAHISLGNTSHVVKPAIRGVGKYNLSQRETVITFEQ